MNTERLEHLISRWRDGEISDSESDELNELLRQSKEARKLFSREATLHGLLSVAVADEVVESVSDLSAARTLAATNTLLTRKSAALAAALSALAAGILVAIGMTWIVSRNAAPHGESEPIIAKILSREDAAWESALPTAVGSELSAGTLTLKAGVATILFRSGVKVSLEAPAQLELIDPMRGRINHGAAVIDVPDSAIGFVIETPDGYAVDYGTKFAVLVDAEKEKSDFELIEGEISVHHPGSGEELRLSKKRDAATIVDDTLFAGSAKRNESPTRVPSASDRERRVRLQADILSSVLKNQNRHRKWHSNILKSNMLSARKAPGGRFDHYSLLAFDLPDFEDAPIESASFRVNLVPGTAGFSLRLPETCHFRIYGIADEKLQQWKSGVVWDEAPSIDDGVLLGRFEIPRSKQRGIFGISGPRLLRFLNENQGKRVTLVLYRETQQLETGPGDTHLFAGYVHPESVGPIIEMVVGGQRSASNSRSQNESD